jgi:hypothetical protein
MPQAIEVTTQRKRTLGVKPHVVIDGHDTGVSDWGALLYPVAPGAHQIVASVQGIVATVLEVTVRADEVVSVLYLAKSGLGNIKASIALTGSRGVQDGPVAPLAAGYTYDGPAQP